MNFTQFTHPDLEDKKKYTTPPVVQQRHPPTVGTQLTLCAKSIAIREDLRDDLSQRDAIHGLPTGARRGVPGFLVYAYGVNPERAFGDFERELVRLDQVRGGPGRSRRSLDYWRETLAIMMELASLLRMEDANESPVQMRRTIQDVRTRRERRRMAGGFNTTDPAAWSAANARPDSVAAIRQLRLLCATSEYPMRSRAHREECSIRRLGQRRSPPEVGYAVGTIDYTDDLYSSSDSDD